MCLMPSCNSESADSGWANHSSTSGDVSKLPWWGIPVSSHFETNPFRGDCIPFNRCNIVWWGCSWGPYGRQMDSVSLLAFLVVVGCYVLRTTSPMRWFKDIYGSWPVSALKMVRPNPDVVMTIIIIIITIIIIIITFMRGQNLPPPLNNMLVEVITSTLFSWGIKIRHPLWAICSLG